MRKTVLYLVVLVCLIVATYFIVIKKEITTIKGNDTDFAIEDISEIHKIFMADKSGKQVILELKETGWIVNNKYPVLKGSINGLIKVINKVRIKNPVPKKQHNTIVKQMSVKATKIEIFNKNNDLIKSYYVGGPTNDHLGTYMIMDFDGELAEKPYVTHVPGFEGFLSPYYFLEERLWRDRTIFSYTPEEIQSITLSYSANPENSFKIIRADHDSFTVKPLFADSIPNNVHPFKNLVLNKNMLSKYIYQFRSIYAEAYQYDNPLEDSIRQSVPICKIVIESLSAQNSITIHYMGIDERTKNRFDKKGELLKYDGDRYFSFINNGNDLVVIQNYVFRKIMVKYSDFWINQLPAES